MSLFYFILLYGFPQSQSLTADTWVRCFVSSDSSLLDFGSIRDSNYYDVLLRLPLYDLTGEV